MMKTKLSLLIISAVYPFPRNAGQQQRVFYTLKALRNQFYITFLTFASLEKREFVEKELLSYCDEAIVFPSVYNKTLPSRIYYKLNGLIYVLITGLKMSNYIIGEVEFSIYNLRSALDGKHFDCVLFEYWHAHKATAFFRACGIPAALDMHDILWRSYSRQWDAKSWVPVIVKRWFIQRYQTQEESAWTEYDILIAINQNEMDYSSQRVSAQTKMFYLPMGIDISAWPYCWQPANPRRIAYYGGLGSVHNQHDALLCYREIMPQVWKEFPDTEFWFVGSNPPDFIRALTHDPRVRVTGFIEQVQDVLRTMTFVLCPWSGTYGFRSRIVEVMALGVPVVASKDAVDGMGFEVERGIVLADSLDEMVDLSLIWMKDVRLLEVQSLLARQQMEKMFDFETTYVRFSQELSIHLSHLQKNAGQEN